MRIIDTMLRESAMAVDGIKHYAHSPEPYADVQETELPRVWIYDTRPRDKIQANHTVLTSYRVVMEISTGVELSEDPENLEAAWDIVQKLWIKFIHKLSSHPANVIPIGYVERVEILHHLAVNVVGFVCTFEITPLDNPEYQCL